MEENLETKEKDLNDIKKELNASPMYNLSLSSKELFHSNFLAWLGNNMETRPFFVAVINELAGIVLDSNGDWKVAREDKNFDLCIREEKTNEKGKKYNDYLLVIENKVKSIPRKSQLDEYVNKIKILRGNKENTNDTKYLLLTLVEKFPHKDDINKENGGDWQIKTYNDLANIMDMDKNKSLVKDSYFKLLLNDYKVFIENMNALAGIWLSDTNKEAFAKTTDFKGLEKISDLYAKLQFSMYCIKLQDMIQGLGDNIMVCDSIQDGSDNDIYIYVGWGYSSKGKSGLLDIAIPVAYDNENDNYNEKPKIKYGCCFPKCEYTIKIQVQGRSYCHVLEKTSGDRNLVKTGYGAPYTDDLGWFSKKDPKDPQSDSKVNYGNNNLFENGLYPQNKVSNWPFKSYSSTFIYQSKIINENAKVDDVLKNIVGEVERVLAWLSK